MQKALIGFRKKKQISQEALARLIGVSVITVSRWERGLSVPSPLAREKLLHVLNGGK